MLYLFINKKNVFLSFVLSALFLQAGFVYAEGSSTTDATPLNIGQEINAQISEFGEQDFFRIQLASGGNLEVSASGSNDTFGELLNSAGTVIASNDDAGDGFNFAINQQVSAGIYYIKVRLWSAYRTGHYALQLSCTGCSSTGSGDTGSGDTGSGDTGSGDTGSGDTGSGDTGSGDILFPESVYINPNSSHTGAISVTGEHDYYRIQLATGGNLAVSTSGTSDTFGELLNSAGTVIASNDDSGERFNFSISRQVAAGTYYIKVRLYSAYRTGNYGLSINCSGCTDGQGGDTGSGDTGSGDTGSGDTGSGDTGSGDTGSGDTGSGDTGSGDTGSGDTGSGDILFPGSVYIGPNSSHTGAISVTGEHDYYRIQLATGGDLVVSTSGTSDTFGELLNSAGTVIASNDDSGERFNFSISRQVAAGTYYIKVRLYSAYRTGNYGLSINCSGCTSGQGGDTGSGDTGSGDTGSGDTGSGDTGSGDTGSGDTGSGDSGNRPDSGSVPFLRQHDYAYINEGAAMSTSLAMILQYYYPDSAIDPRVIYHSGIQAYRYFGQASEYRNVRRNNSSYALLLSQVSLNARNSYLGSSSISMRNRIDDYLSHVWDVDTVTLNGADQIYSTIGSDPIFANVHGKGNTIYNDSHFVVITSIDQNNTSTRSDDFIIVNDPYDTHWPNINSSGNGRRIPYQEFFSQWFIQGIKLVPNDTASQRAHTVVVDNGNNTVSGVSSIHQFVVSNYNDWNYNYSNGDWFNIQSNGNVNNATWKPRLLRSGRYEITTTFKGNPDDGVVRYEILNNSGQILDSSIVYHGHRAGFWLTRNISNGIYLENGFSVRGVNVSGANIDSLKFKYLGQ